KSKRPARTMKAVTLDILFPLDEQHSPGGTSPRIAIGPTSNSVHTDWKNRLEPKSRAQRTDAPSSPNRQPASIPLRSYGSERVEEKFEQHSSEKLAGAKRWPCLAAT